MLGDKKPEDLNDQQLIAVFRHCEAAMLKRWEASAHPKFNDPVKKLEFPSHNPAFEEFIKSIISEIEKRNLNVS